MKLPEHPCAWGQGKGGQGGTTEESPLCTLQSSAHAEWLFFRVMKRVINQTVCSNKNVLISSHYISGDTSQRASSENWMAWGSRENIRTSFWTYDELDFLSFFLPYDLVSCSWLKRWGLISTWGEMWWLNLKQMLDGCGTSMRFTKMRTQHWHVEFDLT
jgi:hypothetical protein